VADLRVPSGADEPAAKRRRIDDGPAATNGQAVSIAHHTAGNISLESAAAVEPVLLEIKDISVSIPQRKKFDIVFTKNYLFARVPNTTAPLPGIVYAWKDIGEPSAGGKTRS
jgi:hypothetical protein